MSPYRIVAMAAVGLSATVWAYACGGGATEPAPAPTPAPDPPRPTTVTVTPASAELTAIGATVQLTADVRDQNGQAMSAAAVVWTSGNASVATVDATGLVTAVAPGTATVTASAGTVRGTAAISVANPDRAALVALYEATDGPNWVNNRNWLTDAPLGEWYGVRTDGSGRVVNVDLAGRWDRENRRYVPHGLAGPIPPALGSLANLLTLRLDNNSLTGPIPSELGGLANLTMLDLASNSLTGPIPSELGGLANLTTLDLGSNSLTGAIPSEFGGLANLMTLGLNSNSLSGAIPSELGNLASLTWLSLTANELHGAIPSELGNVASLTTLNLRDNALSGSIPPEFGNLTNLTELWVSRNRLSGPIPPSLPRLERLEFFYVGGNDLCVPGVSAFTAWLRGVEHHDVVGLSPCNGADIAALTALYEATGGSDWFDSDGWLSDRDVEEWHGVTADSLGRVAELDLERNGLDGELPQKLADLAQMTVLRIGRNALSGRLPLGLASLPLVEFRYAETELCAPAEGSFQSWLNNIPSHEGTGVECDPLSERDFLEAFYQATGGSDWRRSDNWLTDAPLGTWYGVRTDGENRVVGLFLSDNGLVGTLPPELGNLANLTQLSLRSNGLSGSIPPELGNLPNLAQLSLRSNGLSGSIPSELGNLGDLTHLSLGNNRFSGPIPPELGNLGGLTDLNLGYNDLSGPIPPELGNLANLTRLNLTRNLVTGPIPPELANLSSLELLALGGNVLEGSIPAGLGRLAGLERLLLWGNNLTGQIPPDLGNLAQVTYLSLSSNQLSGPIPAELGSLGSVTELHLQGNALTGAIPGELGRLASVERLLLWGNELSGAIPPELGDLATLKILSLSDNELSGAIPGEFGKLRSVTYLALDENTLSGTLPAQLGDLSTLEYLLLDKNGLTGPVPTEFGGMSGLRELSFTNNSAMSGPLPAGLTALDRLDALLAGGTGLCAPSDAGFQVWLAGVHKRRIAPCVEGDPPTAYLTQAVQSREFPVPLIAGRRALLRVFPTADRTTSTGIPAVRARFYVDGREIHVEEIPGKSAPIPTEVDESALAHSANADIPGEVLRPGLEMVIEVDPEGTLDPGLGVATRIPETDRLAVEVRAVPPFDLTLIPFIWTETRDSSIVDLVGAMAADPDNHEMFGDTRALLPIGEFDVTAHEPVLSSTNSAFALLAQTIAIRAIEGGTGHFKGMMPPPLTGAGGVARLPGRSSFSGPSPATIAHELGHNLSLYHAPCGGAGGPDPSFPYSDGSIGAWGWDFRGGGRLVRPSTADIMSYCTPRDAISDYHFTNALRFRLSDADSVGLPDRAPPTRSLLLWGGLNGDGVPFLEPAFVVNAPPGLPRSGDDYRLSGRTESGAELFSFSFAMPTLADGDGRSSFAFVLPVHAGWEGSLASITLTGPSGSVALDKESEQPVAILRDRGTGQVRGFLRDLPATVRTLADAAAVSPEPGLEVLFSRGIPGADAWRD